MPDETGKSKILIDEDWKSQVEAEKAAAARQQAEQVGGSQGEYAASEAGADAAAANRADLPPPTLSSLVVTLATQAMAAMGLLGDAEGKPLPPQPDEAKYLIDTIAMLEAKTANNRTPDESKLFDEALHQLRMTFVSVGKGATRA